MPAAAVIPAPVAYTNIAAVETFVVGPWALVCRVAGGLPPPAGGFNASRPRGFPPEHNPWQYGPVPALRWSDQLPCEVSFSGDRNGQCTQHMLGRPRGCWPRATHSSPVHHRSLPSQSPWKTQCAQSNQNWLNAPPWNVTVSTECWQESCAGLGAHLGQRGAVPRRILRGSTPFPAPGPVLGLLPASPVVVAASNASKGTVQGARDCSARGEILRPLQDHRRRRRSARARSLIKSESLGIEDDQTPS